MSLKVLVVDDHSDNVMVIKMILEKRGYTVLDATGYPAGLAIGLSEDFDLLIADLDIDGFSGIDLLLELKKKKTFSSLAISAHCSEENKRNTIAAGFDAFLSKPFRLPELLAAVADLTDAKASVIKAA